MCVSNVNGCIVLRFLGLMNSSMEEEDVYRPTIHISKLQGTVRWGDIILFRCVNSLSNLQRTITGSNWDHVGVVVCKHQLAKSSNYHTIHNNHIISELYLLEATAQGVTVLPLLPRLNAYHNTKVLQFVILLTIKLIYLCVVLLCNRIEMLLRHENSGDVQCHDIVRQQCEWCAVWIQTVESVVQSGV